MKITIDIECTPAEARQLMGLPDMQPFQERMRGELEKHFNDAVRRMSPEAVLQQWFSGWPIGREAAERAAEKPRSSGKNT